MYLLLAWQDQADVTSGSPLIWVLVFGALAIDVFLWITLAATRGRRSRLS